MSHATSPVCESFSMRDEGKEGGKEVGREGEREGGEREERH